MLNQEISKMKLKNKYVVLKAMREVLQKYLDRIHINQYDDCPLCELYRNTNYILELRCSGCPMYVFQKDEFQNGCISRNCTAVDCRFIDNKNYITDDDVCLETKLTAVIEFYKEAIEKIESMNFIVFMFTDYQFLVEIDECVAKKFKLI